MKRCYSFLLTICLLFAGCAPTAEKQHNAVYLDLFDTVTTIIGSGGNEEQFRQEAQKIHDQLLVYHRLFDIYNTYDGIHNLKTVNDMAGTAPVTVDRAIIELLLDCKQYYELTDGKVNAAMGSVLRLWHEARAKGLDDPENAELPDKDALKLAAAHISFDNIVIDKAKSTVCILDPKASLDVGAIAKGWAVQRVAEAAPAGLLISVGGNVCATGAKNEDGTPWTVGIQDPENAGEYLQKVQLACGAVVTSGDYQRTYEVDGEQYHHIIDPKTQMPSSYWRSVTVICDDSGLADALSTALFLLPLQEGKALADQCGANALWLDRDGMEFRTDGLQAIIVKS